MNNKLKWLCIRSFTQQICVWAVNRVRLRLVVEILKHFAHRLRWTHGIITYLQVKRRCNGWVYSYHACVWSGTNASCNAVEFGWVWSALYCCIAESVGIHIGVNLNLWFYHYSYIYSIWYTVFSRRIYSVKTIYRYMFYMLIEKYCLLYITHLKSTWA